MRMNDSGLPPVQRQVMEALMLHADDDDVAWVTKRQLAEHTGLSADSVDRALRVLRAKGWVGEPVSQRMADGFIRYGFRVHRDGPYPMPLSGSNDH